MKFLLNVDTSHFQDMVSSDDFESDELIDYLRMPPSIQAITLNGGALDISQCTATPTSSLHRFDMDVSLVPQQLSPTSSYESNLVMRLYI